MTVIPKHLRIDILRLFYDEATIEHLGFAKRYDGIIIIIIIGLECIETLFDIYITENANEQNPSYIYHLDA